MALNDTRSLSLVDPSHPVALDRRKSALGCGTLSLIVGVVTMLGLSDAVSGAPWLLVGVAPLALVGAAAAYAGYRPRRLRLTRQGDTLYLGPSDMQMHAGGQLTLVATTQHLGRGRHAPAVKLFYTAQDTTLLVDNALQVEAMQSFAERIAPFMSATVYPVVLPAGTRPPERLTSAYDTGPQRGECPRCAVALDRIGGPLDEHHCAQCGGRLLGTIGTERLVEEELGVDRPMMYALRAEWGGRGAHCPLCTSVMNRTRLKGEVVDLCGGCGALWLDAGELSRLSRNRYPEGGASEADDPTAL